MKWEWWWVFICCFEKEKLPEKKVQEAKNKLVVSNEESNKLKSDVDELKNMVFELASMQKKQNKINKKRVERKSGGTKIVVLPNNTSQSQEQKQDNSTMAALRRSLGM